MAKRRAHGKAHGQSFAGLFASALEQQRRGRTREAIVRYEQAIRLNATVPEAHNNLGCALLALGRLDDACAALARAVALRPAYAEALDTLGVVLSALGRHGEAVGYFERALGVDPPAAATAVHLGNAQLALERLPQARLAFERALELQPGHAAALNGLGAVLGRLGDDAAATPAFRAALASDPAFADAACNLGNALLATGAVDEAVGWFERAIELEPRNSRFHLQLVRSRSRTDARHLATLESLLAPGAGPAGQARIELHFALAKAYEDDRRYDDAFVQLAAGNALKRAALAYDPATELAFFAQLERAIDPLLLAALRGYGNPSEQPVFLFGMPRSGSTLVEQILAAHPAVAAAGETGALGRLIAEVRPPIGTGAPPAQVGASLRVLGDRYVAEIAELGGAALRITDKTLANFSLAPLIHSALPNARLIHVQRDRLDTCFSAFATLFSGAYVPFSYDLGELDRYYQGYETLMNRWRTLLPAGRLLEVSYEAVVADIETQARRIVAFCGLSWDDACLAFTAARRAVRTASAFQVRQPLYGTAIGRAQRFRSHLGPLISAAPGSSHS